MTEGITGTSWREMRWQAGVSIRELELRTGINRGRLSIIERGVPPSEEEAGRIRAVLVKAIEEKAA